MKKIIQLFICSLLFSVSLQVIAIDKKDYQARQVKGVPATQPKPPLSIDKHIRFTPRPHEVYDFPIKLGEVGPVEPLYAGGPQYPFYCMTLDSNLGQPVVDNKQGLGVPVYDDTDNIIGYSKDCGLPSRVRYVAELDDGKFEFFSGQPPKNYRHLYRFEQGTINRFIYGLVMPIGLEDIGSRTQTSKWNNRLIYRFDGGSGIGFRQGRMKFHKIAKHIQQQLHDGYAVITSTGNRTSYTYNMLLAEDTARRVKHQFVSLYGEPLHTIGIGGSGGGLAQYLIGQNSEGILDGLIPLYSYPDMVSQTLYALDCDLLNAYYSFKAPDPNYWQDWNNRRKVDGLNAKNGLSHFTKYLEVINQFTVGRIPTFPKGNSECINGWFGLASFVHNPSQGFLREFFADQVVETTQWTYWEDMVSLYGRDDNGYARSTWGNHGVQYGLEALRQDAISMEQFIHINWNIGSWKPMQQMEPEMIWAPWGKKLALWLTLWSRHNITLASQQPSDLKPKVLAAGFYTGNPDPTPAMRSKPDTKAIEAAYRSGQIFIGQLDLPVIDIRHYLEDELDMHHMSASFTARLRMQQTMGHSDNHIIWVSDKKVFPVTEAFAQMDQWLHNIKRQPDKTAAQVKPPQLQDTCIGADNQVLYAGTQVWDGVWNNQPVGACLKRFPMYTDSRIQAGGPWQGGVFQCHLIPVQQAVKLGFYGKQDVSDYVVTLERLFPDGVCDYRRGDAAKPRDI